MKKLLALLLALTMLCAACALAEGVDATTGGSQTVNPETQLTQEEIRELALTYLRGAGLYRRTLYSPERRDAMDVETQKATILRIAKVNEWIEIIPTEYVVNSLHWSFNKEESRRPQYYDPESPYFGKEVRQVYHVGD